MEAAASHVERQAEVRLSLGWLPSLEWVKGLLMKHESALKLGEGVGGGGGLWPNLVHNCGGTHPPCALGMLSFTKFMSLLTCPVHLCASPHLRRISTQSQALYPMISAIAVITDAIIAVLGVDL